MCLRPVREGHGDWPHAKWVHLVGTDDLSFRSYKLFNMIGVGHNDIFPAVAVPNERRLNLPQTIRSIFCHSVNILNWVTDEIK